MSDVRNVIIIGSGPAGYTAGIYTARANLEPLMFEGIQPGGQLMITTDVENYPGFPEGVEGPHLMELFKKQAERFGTETLTQNVDKVDFSKRPFRVWSEGKEYAAQTIIVATGATAKLIGLESEQKLMGYGVSACATCDGFFFKDKDVCIVGGGDTAMEEANFLTRFAKKVHVIHRRSELRASKIMQQRAMANPKIDFVWNSEVIEVLDPAKKAIEALRLRDTVTGKESVRPTEGLFVAIGHQPNTKIFEGQLATNDVGYLATTQTTRTSVDGVFACGDVMDPVWRQAITAAGTGCAAAIDAERWLEAHGSH
ncbi:MAG: thioredoxin-disulfide reductase [Planctomycetes bacterium]|nr:thioredoxin-disulfide reductase [Planctomycetota bacterium]